MDIKNILVYQDAQLSLVQMEKEYNESEIMRKFNEIKSKKKEAKVAIESINAAIEKTSAISEELANKHKEIQTEMSDVLKEDFEALETSQLTFYQKRLEKYSGDLDSIDRDLNKTAGDIRDLNRKLSQYVDALGKISEVFEKVKEVATKYNNEKIKPMFDAATVAVKAAKEKLSDSDVTLYDTIRAEIGKANSTEIGNAKVFVPARENFCGGCGLEIKAQDFEKLSEAGYVKCSHCGRIIYILK